MVYKQGHTVFFGQILDKGQKNRKWPALLFPIPKKKEISDDVPSELKIIIFALYRLIKLLILLPYLSWV
jgi:hypothetical protein